MKYILLSIKIFFLTIALVGNWGCATVPYTPTFIVHVDSISDKAPILGQCYILKSGMEGVIENDLRFREFSNYIEKVLIEKGYIKSTKQEDTDIVIFLQYGISEPQTTQHVNSTPIYGEIPSGTATLNTSTHELGGFTHTTGTVSVPTKRGIIGSEQETSYITTYTRYFKLDAIDYKAYKTKEEIIPRFQTIVKSEGYNNDLRFVFPVMVGAAAPYFGKNTGKQLTISLPENDPRVLKIKGVQSND